MSFVERLGMGMKGESARAEDARQSFPSMKAPDRLTVEIDVLTRMIAERERSLSALKQRRKALINKRTWKRTTADPTFQATRVAALRGKFSNDAHREEFQRRCREAQIRTGRALPPMTKPQALEYRRLRHKMSRVDALKLVLAS